MKSIKSRKMSLFKESSVTSLPALQLKYQVDPKDLSSRKAPEQEFILASSRILSSNVNNSPKAKPRNRKYKHKTARASVEQSKSRRESKNYKDKHDQSQERNLSRFKSNTSPSKWVQKIGKSVTTDVEKVAEKVFTEYIA